jgi:predicted metal-dependent phosphoesterase TrpH
MLKKFKADMHIHTCLSPCTDWDMSPKKIIQRSLDIGLDVIAICDHNTAENAGAVMKEGKIRGLRVLPGIEICSKEEVHILALFDELDKTLAMQDYIYAKEKINPKYSAIRLWPMNMMKSLAKTHGC